MFSGSVKRAAIGRYGLSRPMSTTTSSSAPARSMAFKHNRKKYIFASILGVGTLTYATNDQFHDGLNHTVLTIGRVSVVTNATVKCLYHYKRVLGVEYTSPTERYHALSKCHKQCAEITLKALEKNGGIYIKLGQHVSAMTYLLPPEWTDTMIPLQDNCPQSSYEDIDKMFHDDWGKGIDELFDEFNKKPIGVASLAQVHVAKLKSNGEKVAVKCQHPSLKRFVPLDVYLTQIVFKALDAVFPDYPLVWLGDELRDSIFVELNFNKEAENSRKTDEYFANFQNLTALRIPKILKSSNRILLMEYVAGSRLDNPEFFEQNKVDRSQVSSCLAHTFNNMVFTPGVSVHCDPHGGNLAIRMKPENEGNPLNPYNFEIILYDHGLYRDVPTQLRTDYARFWLAMIDRDQVRMKEFAKKFANIDDAQFPILAAAITGRAIETALDYDISKERDEVEIERMKHALTEGELLTDLMVILSKIPRVVLLIIKTNDLTRHLDEVLKNPLGPERTFLILSQYAAKTVYLDNRDRAKTSGKQFVKRWVDIFKAWCEYNEWVGKLYLYDIVVLIKGWLHRA